MHDDLDMVAIPGGEVVLGSTKFYPEEAPLRQTRIDAFRMDRHPVTNARFARFVGQTGYVTVAERPLDPRDFPGADPAMLQPGSLVFRKPAHRVDLRSPAGWWNFEIGACWRHPLGPGSTLDGLENHPVVHIACADAEAFAQWAGKQLPSEAEWEHAARGGLIGREYAWGDELAPEGKPLANYWQGSFPYENSLLDGYERTSPVGSFPANGYGLFDMIGNVWEWTSDWYVEATWQVPPGSERSCCAKPKPLRAAQANESFDPLMPQLRIPRRVIKGGSHLCAENYCQRYRPAARHPQQIDSSTTHVGFRCVSREA
ncbi:MAG: formylglycine-generating enzyme family protein [Pseudoxanthomonas sp.]